MERIEGRIAFIQKIRFMGLANLLTRLPKQNWMQTWPKGNLKIHWLIGVTKWTMN